MTGTEADTWVERFRGARIDASKAYNMGTRGWSVEITDRHGKRVASIGNVDAAHVWLRRERDTVRGAILPHLGDAPKASTLPAGTAAQLAAIDNHETATRLPL